MRHKKSKRNEDSSGSVTAAANNITVQRRLNIGAVNDPLENQADAVADKVMRMPEPNLVQRKCSSCEGEEAQRKPISSSLTPFIQAKSNDTASDAVSSRINSTKGSGSSIDGSTKSFMESRFGTDFSGVKIHTGNYAAEMSRELNAKAFTVGNDIYFNSGEYNTGSNDGKHLLAHELTHTIQQGGSDKSSQVQSKIQKKAGPAKKTVWLHIGFDSSAQANESTMKKLRASIASEEAALAHCCSSKSKACDVQIKYLFDWNRNNKPAPTDGDYDSDVPADLTLKDDNIKKINTGKSGGVRMLVTGSTLSQTWQGTRIFANAQSGTNSLIWNVNVAPEETMAHETGHIAGYSGGDIEGNVHSSDPDNLMSRGDIRH